MVENRRGRWERGHVGDVLGLRRARTVEAWLGGFGGVVGGGFSGVDVCVGSWLKNKYAAWTESRMIFVPWEMANICASSISALSPAASPVFYPLPLAALFQLAWNAAGMTILSTRMQSKEMFNYAARILNACS